MMKCHPLQPSKIVPSDAQSTPQFVSIECEGKNRPTKPTFEIRRCVQASEKEKMSLLESVSLLILGRIEVWVTVAKTVQKIFEEVFCLTPFDRYV